MLKHKSDIYRRKKKKVSEAMTPITSCSGNKKADVVEEGLPEPGTPTAKTPKGKQDSCQPDAEKEANN